MREFAELFHDLDGMTKTGDRIDRMSAYFRDADPKDAGWAAWFLAGNRIKGAVRTGELREWVAQRANLPFGYWRKVTNGWAILRKQSLCWFGAILRQCP